MGVRFPPENSSYSARHHAAFWVFAELQVLPYPWHDLVFRRRLTWRVADTIADCNSQQPSTQDGARTEVARVWT